MDFNDGASDISDIVIVLQFGILMKAPVVYLTLTALQFGILMIVPVVYLTVTALQFGILMIALVLYLTYLVTSL